MGYSKIKLACKMCFRMLSLKFWAFLKLTIRIAGILAIDFCLGEGKVEIEI